MSDHGAWPIIERLGLEPHPEGGWYRETWRAPAADGIPGFTLAPPGWQPFGSN